MWVRRSNKLVCCPNLNRITNWIVIGTYRYKIINNELYMISLELRFGSIINSADNLFFVNKLCF